MIRVPDLDSQHSVFDRERIYPTSNTDDQESLIFQMEESSCWSQKRVTKNTRLSVGLSLSLSSKINHILVNYPRTRKVRFFVFVSVSNNMIREISCIQKEPIGFLGNQKDDKNSTTSFIKKNR